MDPLRAKSLGPKPLSKEAKELLRILEDDSSEEGPLQSSSSANSAESGDKKQPGTVKSSENFTRLLINESLTKMMMMNKQVVICDNANCRRKVDLDKLVDASKPVMVALGLNLSTKGGWKVCQKCVKKATELYEDGKRAVKENGNLFSVKFEIQPKPVTIDLCDDDKENVDQNAVGGTSAGGQESLKENANYVKTNGGVVDPVLKETFDNVLSNILGKLNFKSQVSKCVATVKANANNLAIELSELEAQSDALDKDITSVSAELKSILDRKIKSENETTHATKETECDDDNPKEINQQPSYSVRNEQFVFSSPKVGEIVYAMNEDLLRAWSKAKIEEVFVKNEEKMYKVTIQGKGTVTRTGFQLAFSSPVKLTILPVGTRVIAKFIDLFGYEPITHNKYFAGIITEGCEPQNNSRCLIFFDDGFCQYVSPMHVLPVVKASVCAWKDMHKDHKSYVKSYFKYYPERYLVKSKPGDLVQILYGVKFTNARVEQIDCSLMKVEYLDHEASARYEWIYRGSSRIDEVKKKGKCKRRINVSLENTCSSKPVTVDVLQYYTDHIHMEKTGTMQKICIPPGCPRPRALVPHVCSSICAQTYRAENFRECSPLIVPFYLGWARDMAQPIGYITPCGRRLVSYDQIFMYNFRTATGIPIDFYSLEPTIDCLNQFVASYQRVFTKDISYGMEWTPVECVNSFSTENPDFWHYSKNSVLGQDVNINDEKGFFVCCDCTDGCKDKETCPCWQLTLSGISFQTTENKPTGYVNRRLPEWIPSGIYECNKYCKCKAAVCCNRVVQNEVNWPVQVFKTHKKGWGVRALYDIPKGSFLCVYTGRILRNDDANLEGKTYGDQYIADLDYIEAMEGMKDGYEYECVQISSSESSSDDETNNGLDGESGLSKIKQYYKDKTSSKKHEQPQLARKSTSGGKPMKKFRADADSKGIQDQGPSNEYEKFGKAVRFRPQFGLGNANKPYTVDGNRFGNFGRLFNHSCDPNIFIQSVFINTHDIRFPSVAFFTCKDIKAGTELCWDYKYQVGSVSGKTLPCFCGSKICRKILL